MLVSYSLPGGQQRLSDRLRAQLEMKSYLDEGFHFGVVLLDLLE